MKSVAIFGSGQLGSGVARILRARGTVEVLGPYDRESRSFALESGADVVVIATTTRLSDVADDIATAVKHRSNVLVSAEEAANPRAIDPEIAERIDQLAVENGVSVAGVGINPGLLYDALVLTLLGATVDGAEISVFRTVDLTQFGTTVLRRIGIGLTPEAFAAGVAAGRVLGHAGFPQSMTLVADAIGLTVMRIDKSLIPVIASESVVAASGLHIAEGESRGVLQVYTARTAEGPWFTANFRGEVRGAGDPLVTADVIELRTSGELINRVTVEPGIGAQAGSQNMIANSVDRIVRSRPGWRTVAELVPAFPSAATQNL